MAKLGDGYANQMASIAERTNHIGKEAYVDYVLEKQSETGHFGT